MCGGCRLIISLIGSLFLLGGVKTAGQDSSKRPAPGPEILSSGFLDIGTNGQVNASARLIRIFLGEPGKISIPLSIYSGVSSGNFAPGAQNPVQGGNESLFSSFLNPMNGIVNVSFEGLLRKNARKQITSARVICHWGGRLLTGYRQANVAGIPASRPLNFFNGYAVSGLYFQTGAWERSDAENLGIFWISARYIWSFSSRGALRHIIPDTLSGFYHGWSVGGGIDISSLVNVRIVYYRYVKEPETGFQSSLCQFSFNYALRH